jgi:hypothetical protein
VILCSVVSLANDGHSEGPMHHNLKIGRNFNKSYKHVIILPIRESNISNNNNNNNNNNDSK